MGKILIIDDEAIIGLQLEAILSSMGLEVVGVGTSGKEALSMTKELNPDLILMDIVMPRGMNGIDAGAEIKGEFNIPIIFITAHADGKWVRKAKRIDPFGYILKPFQEEQIKAVVEIALHRIDLEKRLKESESNFHQLVELSPFPVSIIDSASQIQYLNKRFTELFGYVLTDFPKEAKWYKKLFSNSKNRKIFQDVLKSGQSETNIEPLEFKVRCKNKKILDVLFRPVSLESGKQFITFEDMTLRNQLEKMLRNERDQLEKMVAQQTEELEIKSQNLEDANFALKSLLKKRDEEKFEFEEKIQVNIEQMVLPYMEKLQATNLDSTQSTVVEIMATSLQEVTSSFSHTLSTKYRSLTPKEIQIANLIKQGQTTREIAKILNISKRTIDAHRNHIREKLKLKKKGGNLRTHLLSIR